MSAKSETQGFDVSGFCAAVIGCGGLGCNIAVHLAGAGFGKIILCDFDTVSESNLNRQFLYTPADTGEKKSVLAARRLRAYAPECEIVSVDRKIADPRDLSFAAECDIIFLAVDNNAARKTAARFCAANGIPLVNGGISGFCGTAYLYVPGKSACPDCAGLLSGETENIVSVGTTAGVIGALQAELGIKYLINKGTDAAGFLHFYNDGELDRLKIKPRKNCGLCEGTVLWNN